MWPLVAMRCNVMQCDAMQCDAMRCNAMLARSAREDSTEVTDIVTMPFSSSTLLPGVNYVASDAASLRASVTIGKKIQLLREFSRNLIFRDAQ